MKKSISKLLVCTMFLSLSVPFGTANAAVVPSEQNLEINGLPVHHLSVYNLDGQNYFRLKDLAYYLDYELEYDTEADAVLLWKGGSGQKPESLKQISGTTPSIVPSQQTLFVNGENLSDRLNPVNINGYNYFKIRELAQAADFGLFYDADTNTVKISSDYSYDVRGLSRTSRLPENWKAELKESLSIDKALLFGTLHATSYTTKSFESGDAVNMAVPTHDWWSEQSEEVKTITDRDLFNLCVNVLKDRDELDRKTQDAIDSGIYRGRWNPADQSECVYAPDYVYPYAVHNPGVNDELMMNVIHTLLPNHIREALLLDDTGRVAQLPEYYDPSALDGQPILMATSGGNYTDYTVFDITEGKPGYENLEKFVRVHETMNDHDKYVDIYRYVTDRLKPGDTYLEPAELFKDHNGELAVTQESYSGMVYELCRLLDLPVTTLGGDNFSVNLVYVNNTWYFTDAYTENATGIFVPVTAMYDRTTDFGSRLDLAKDLVTAVIAVTNAAGGM